MQILHTHSTTPIQLISSHTHFHLSPRFMPPCMHPSNPFHITTFSLSLNSFIPISPLLIHHPSSSPVHLSQPLCLSCTASRRRNHSNANSTVTGGDHKEKKKGLSAKNLMVKRGRQRKLNDRLYMPRSVIPKSSKMDEALVRPGRFDHHICCP